MNPTAEQKIDTAAFLRDFKLQEQLRALEEVDEREDRINTEKNISNFSSYPERKGLVSPFNTKIIPGEFRLLSQTDHLTYAAVLPWDDIRVLLIPLSTFEHPASDQEMYVEESEKQALHMKVYQVWNARTVNKAVLARSWVMGKMSERDIQRLQQLLRHIWLEDALEDDSICKLTGIPLLPGKDIRKRYMIREQENFRELDSEDLAVEEIPFVLHDTGSWKVFNEAELNLQAAAGETSLSECYLLTESNLKYLGPITLENFVEIPEKGTLPEFKWYADQMLPEWKTWMPVLFRHKRTGTVLGSSLLTPFPDGGVLVSLDNPAKNEELQISSPRDIQLIFFNE